MREARGLLQKEVASVLKVNIAYLSKMEHGVKPFSRNHLNKLSVLFNVNESDLMRLWLADRVLQVVDDEQYAPDALFLVLNELKRK